MKSIGSHPNVVGMIGCCTALPQYVCLVVEHMPGGDLLHYLRGHRHSAQKVGLSCSATLLAECRHAWSGCVSFRREFFRIVNQNHPLCCKIIYLFRVQYYCGSWLIYWYVYGIDYLEVFHSWVYPNVYVLKCVHRRECTLILLPFIL